MSNVLAEIIDKAAAAAEANAPRENEYLDEEGLLRCSVCGDRLQYVTPPLPFLGRESRVVRCVCRCHEEREKQRKEIDRQRVIDYRRRVCFQGTNMSGWNFANDDRKRPQLSDSMKKYAEDFKLHKDSGRGLLLYGPTGTGKTYLAASIANAVIDRGWTAYMTNFKQVEDKLRSTWEKQSYMDELLEYDLLILDDLGVERQSQYMQEIVYNLIDMRYRAGAPMIITTNLTTDEFSKSDSIGNTRIYDRLLERCLPVKVAGHSRRREAARKDWTEMRQQLGMEAPK